MLGKSGSKFRHGGGGYQKRPKNSEVFCGRQLTLNFNGKKYHLNWTFDSKWPLLIQRPSAKHF